MNTDDQVILYYSVGLGVTVDTALGRVIRVTAGSERRLEGGPAYTEQGRVAVEIAEVGDWPAPEWNGKAKGRW